MKLYKYRSLVNFQYVADIFCNRRFHAALFTDLNDPMEGLFEYHLDTPQHFVDRIVTGKQQLRICSFSKSLSNLLLWAHYADGFKGICIEVEIPDGSMPELEDVVYSPYSLLLLPNDIDECKYLSRDVLCCKNQAWDYEEEVRIITTEEYVNDGFSFESVYFGLRTPRVMKKSLSVLVPQHVTLYETKIGRDNCIEKC